MIVKKQILIPKLIELNINGCKTHLKIYLCSQNNKNSKYNEKETFINGIVANQFNGAKSSGYV